jgi:hypothetical protein
MHVTEPSRQLRQHLEKVEFIFIFFIFHFLNFSFFFLFQEYGFTGGKMKGTGGMDNLRNVSRPAPKGDDRGGGRGSPPRGGRDQVRNPSSFISHFVLILIFFVYLSLL